MTAIYEALANVMADVGHVAKRDRNEHQRFLFRGIDAVVNAVGPALRKHQVIVVPTVDEIAYDVVATSTGKHATACRVKVTYTFYATDGSSIETTVAGEAWDSGDKATPKAMSVAFRTALLQALALPTDEPEPDASTYERATAPRQAAPAAGRTMQRPKRSDESEAAISDAQKKNLHRLVNLLGLTREEKLAGVSHHAGRAVESTSDLTRAEASKVIDALQAKVDARDEAPELPVGDE